MPQELINAKHRAYYAALAADDAFSAELKAHNLDRWCDSADWPSAVHEAYRAKRAADDALAAEILAAR